MQKTALIMLCAFSLQAMEYYTDPNYDFYCPEDKKEHLPAEKSFDDTTKLPENNNEKRVIKKN
ncbi:MAG: hypothetical protein KC505_06490 [Myxococcales bacterium]|nr:hypothetical protein [Myxococcales bacterium]USN51053.1 MAG: hypothetical protein H6731_01185 [Myxococcales bacterium]